MAHSSRPLTCPRTDSITLRLAVVVLLSFGAVSAASASEVIDLRIGAHSDFTRVVFELDRPTGYRIERASPSSGVWELVVSLDATSIPRKVQSQKGLIGLVRITPEGSGSVARIQLSQDGLSLKEMILANPPRIVLDVLSPNRASAAAKSTPAPKPKQTASSKSEPKSTAKPAPKPAPEKATPAPKPVPPKPAPSQKPAPKPSEKAVAKAGSAAQATSPAEPELEPGMIRLTDPTPEPQIYDARTAAQTAAQNAAREAQRAAAGAEPSDGMATIGRNMQGDPGAAASDREPPLPAAERVAKRTAMPPVHVTQTEPESGIGLGTIGMGLAGLVVLGGAFVYLRRRSAAADDDYDEGVEVGGPLEPGDDNPFAHLRSKDDQQPLLSSSPGSEGGSGHFELSDLDDDDEKTVEPVGAPLIGDSGITFGDAEQAQDLQSGAGAAEGLSEEGPGDEETMRMIREIERRMASLESRLDEAVDARERLERQVAAQTEELRVQRAAIARTQRAVRNMNRPEEEGPTEPALRDNP